MLTSLRIENFAIVSQLDLDFAPGMSTFTGETGAGKSIMIDALMLALGGRAEASVVRGNAEKCDITACFQIDPTSKPAAWLRDQELAMQEDEVILRRIVYPEGRSKSYINGQPFPLQKMKELSEMLVDIHGQHQHQTLLQHATHRQQLDQYAEHASLLEEVSKRYHECMQTREQLQQIQNQVETPLEIERLQQQLEELDELALREGEMQLLHEEHQLLHHARDYLEHSQQMMMHLRADEHPSIEQQLHQVLHLLALCPKDHPQIINATELIHNALIQCDEAWNEVSRFSTLVPLDPERLSAIEERISRLHHTARKYHVETSQLPAHALHLQQELYRLQHSEQAKQALEKAYQQQLQAYEHAANMLRVSRQQHAEKLAEEITACIQQLGMPQGFVTIEIMPLDKMYAHGSDKVEYYVCTNPGMPSDTLSKVASGGELSRIGLAIHMITAQRATTPTLLFDEVDVGIGGATAALVGQLLRKLGERLQIFCVTHQPQVASCAHHHFKVEKQTHQEQTFSSILPLSPTEKINEIARMLGGLTITEQTRSHARELLTQSV